MTDAETADDVDWVSVKLAFSGIVIASFPPYMSQWLVQQRGVDGVGLLLIAAMEGLAPLIGFLLVVLGVVGILVSTTRWLRRLTA